MLYERPIANHTSLGDIVYEPFSGSGTALIAAENLSRQCRAVEISPGYVAVALQRYLDAFGIRGELAG
jgi:DNA modification methylase